MPCVNELCIAGSRHLSLGHGDVENKVVMSDVQLMTLEGQLTNGTRRITANRKIYVCIHCHVREKKCIYT